MECQGPFLETITVIKKNIHGQETWRYTGQVLKRTANEITIEAFFDREDIYVAEMLLAKGDRFVESYFTGRWFNIYEIYASGNGALRGWYCNVSTPVEVEDGQIAYVDLALDLLVFPDGRQVVLDEDEFAALEISADLRAKALAGLNDLQELFHNKY
jgi:protein associated with RNAse G/E